MGSKDELNKNDIENHTCYHFDDIKRIIDIDFDILLYRKL